MKLTPSKLKAYREQELQAQNYICPLCLGVIPKEKAHLDHCHTTGKVRRVLHAECNMFEGMLLHKFKRSGIKVPLHEWLARLKEYHEQDYSDQPEHPTHRAQETRQFKQLKKQEMQQVLRDLKIEPIGTKADLIKLFNRR